jgi:AraC-like DNA-binding protein
MIQLLNVHFDRDIPNWRTQMEVLRYNVLVLVADGNVRYEIDGNEVIAEKGDFLYIPRSTRRSGMNYAGIPHRKHTVVFTLEPGVTTGVPFLDQGAFIRFRLANFQSAQRHFQRLFEEMRGGMSFKGLICLGIAQELIGILARELEKPEMPPSKMKYAQIVRQYLLEHYREPIEIEQLARLIHRSPNYTTALFKEVFGQPPIRYMHQLRVLEAGNLLLDSDMTIASISQYLGYYDTSYFFRIFRKYSSMSPSEFIARGRPADLSQLFS